MDEMEIGGQIYISSKRAAAESGYAQDYVGQLARKGFIDAQRIGGLWYVLLDSVIKYKRDAEQAKAEFHNNLRPPLPAEPLIQVDNKDYASAAHAAELTGYHADYIGQLAREQKVPSRQIGNRWYIDKSALLEHKKEKDALLAAVQADSVGLKYSATPQNVPKQAEVKETDLLKYQADERDLVPLPRVSNAMDLGDSVDMITETSVPRPIPIRVVDTNTGIKIARKNRYISPHDIAKIPGKAMFILVFLVIITLIMLGLSRLQMLLKIQDSMFAIGTYITMSVEKTAISLDPVLSLVEKAFVKDLTYIRK